MTHSVELPQPYSIEVWIERGGWDSFIIRSPH